MNCLSYCFNIGFQHPVISVVNVINDGGVGKKKAKGVKKIVPWCFIFLYPSTDIREQKMKVFFFVKEWKVGQNKASGLFFFPFRVDGIVTKQYSDIWRWIYRVY